MTALKGTTSGTVTFGTNIISTQFTICSVTRYTGSTYGVILNGNSGHWFHGHFEEDGTQKTGTAYYNSWRTSGTTYVSPVTNWVAMCGTNAGSQLILVNGVSVGVKSGGSGDQTLGINVGSDMPAKASDFAVAEVMVWNRGLTALEITDASDYLMQNVLGLSPPPRAPPPSPSAP